MRTDTAAFAAKNVALAKRPRYVIEVAFDSANTTLRYFTSHADSALPGGASAILGVVEGLSGTSQTLNPDIANASIGNINFLLVDKASIVTTTLGGQLALGRSTRRQRVRVYVGFEGLAWVDYTLVQTQLVTEISYSDGSYKFSCADVQREMRKDVFDVAKTTLAQSLSIGAATIEVFDTAAFTRLAHGTSYSDAPSATVGYVKIQDEVIRYTGKNSTQFTGCSRGALNTRAVEHAVDATASADRRTAVEEYVYLELPAVKLIYALLTGILSRQFGETGTAQAGSATTLTLAAGVAIGSVSPVGRTLRLTAGAGSVQERIVSAYDGGTKVATVAPRWATNLWLRSEEVDNAAWTKLRATVSANAAVSPTGSTTADTLIEDGTAGNSHFAEELVNITNALIYQWSVWAKTGPGSKRWLVMNSDFVNVGFEQAFFDLALGTVSQQAYGGTATISQYPNGWCRCSVSGPARGTVSGRFQVMLANAGTGGAYNYNGDSTSGNYLWGAQLEQAADLGDYIATAAAAVALPGATTSYALEVTLPISWHLGIPTSYVRLADFTDASKRDLWDTADDQQGFIVRLEGLTKTDGKKFIESELALPCGAFMPVYADGALGLRRMANVLAGASYVRMLDATNLVSVGDLVHDFNALHNVIQIHWNWETSRKELTRVNLLIDAASVATHGRADPLKLKFRGLHGSRHSAVILAQRFDAIRDRYTGPPQRLDVAVLPSLNTLEVGDVVRVRPKGVRDFVAPGGGALDRSFEIHNITTDWITGNLGLKLFASSQAPGAIAATTDATVLSNAWYTSQGTNLTSVLTITGSNPGHVTANGTLTGTADMNAAGSIFYYDGDLQIDAGVTINVVNNVQLRIKGFLQNNGTLNGKGNGPAGAAAKTSTSEFDFNAGTPAFLGTTEAGGGMGIFSAAGQPFTRFDQYRGGSVPGAVSSVPGFNLLWNGTTLIGLPGDLRGSSGSGGMPTSFHQGTAPPTRFGSPAGGAGGAGVLVICRGFAQGVAGVIILSGNDGVVGTPFNSGNVYVYPGSGAGGAPGALVVVLDGAAATATGLTEAGFVALFGKTYIPGAKPDPATWGGGGIFYSDFHGTGDGTTFPLPSLSGARGGSRAQYVPANPAAAADLPLDDVVTQEFMVSNWTERANPKNIYLRDVVWNGAQFVAVGNADGGDAYILTSADGVTWTERANPKNIDLIGVAWNGSIFVAVGGADGADAYIVTSANGIAWTERANPKNFGLWDVLWNGSIFVAVGEPDGADAYIVTSADGVTWTERANPSNRLLECVAWNGALFVAGGTGNGVNGYLVTSPDGTTWTSRTNPQDIRLHALLWVAELGLFLGGGDPQPPGAAVSAYYITSPDGITWTDRSGKVPTWIIYQFAWSGRLLVAVGSTSVSQSPSAHIVSSRDGLAWTPREAPAGSSLMWGLQWSGRRFVAVGPSDGVDARIYTSLSK